MPLLWGQHPQRYPKCKFWDVPSSVPWWLVSRQDDQGTLCGDSTGFVQSGVLILLRYNSRWWWWWWRRRQQWHCQQTVTDAQLEVNPHYSAGCLTRTPNKAQRVESSIWVSRNCCLVWQTYHLNPSDTETIPAEIWEMFDDVRWPIVGSHSCCGWTLDWGETWCSCKGLLVSLWLVKLKMLADELFESGMKN